MVGQKALNVTVQVRFSWGEVTQTLQKSKRTFFSFKQDIVGGRKLLKSQNKTRLSKFEAKTMRQFFQRGSECKDLRFLKADILIDTHKNKPAND